MRDFGVLSGAGLIPLWATLLQEGAFASETETQALVCVNEDTGEKITLYFEADFLVRAEAAHTQPDLAAIFYAKRLLERAQKDKIREQQETYTQLSVGKYVIDQGWVSQSDVAQALINLIEIQAYEVLQWASVLVHLAPAETFLPQNVSSIPAPEFIPMAYFIGETEKNLPVLLLMQQELQDFRWVLKRLKEVQRGELSAQQAHVYRHVNQQRTLAQLLQISDLGYFETLAAVYQLIKWGYLGKGARVEPLKPQSLSAPPREPKASEVDRAKYKIAQRHFLKRDRGAELFSIFETLLAEGYESGELVVESQSEPVRASFVFREGALVQASLSTGQVRLGELLLKKKRVTSVALKTALQLQRNREALLLGQILIENGQVDESDILPLIKHQMACVLYPVLAWGDVKFYFTLQIRPSAQQQVQAPLQWASADAENPLFYEAFKALPMLLMLKERFPSLQLTPVRQSASERRRSDTQEEVLSLVDGLTSFQDILLISELGYLETYVALYQLLNNHTIGLKRKQHTQERLARQVPEQRRFAAPPSAVLSDKVLPIPEADPPPLRLLKSEAHPLETLLGSELCELLLALPEPKHAALRQLITSALELQ